MSDASKIYPADDGRPHTAAVHAASVVIVRDGGDGLEVLMVKRPPGGNFGGYWVFPGGKVDKDDADPADTDEMARFRRAAAREAHEECQLVVTTDDIATISYWEPPPRADVRFGTWFFLAEHPGTEIVIDGDEIVAYEWVRPADGHQRRDEGDFDLAPPTWVTLETLRSFDRVADALAAFRALTSPFDYRTRLGHVDDEGDKTMVAMWTGDAGYEPKDPEQAGPRHRLVMGQRYRFERTI
jgi:8-oxo-dGTP pyrophosphatase MutT (NUDIX family)